MLDALESSALKAYVGNAYSCNSLVFLFQSFMLLSSRLMSNFIPNLFAVPAKPNRRTVQQDRYVCSDKKSQEIYSKYRQVLKYLTHVMLNFTSR